MVELARLESVCTLSRTVGSNPTLSAKIIPLKSHNPFTPMLTGNYKFEVFSYAECF